VGKANPYGERENAIIELEIKQNRNKAKAPSEGRIGSGQPDAVSLDSNQS
jgi:hypothetical protein